MHFAIVYSSVCYINLENIFLKKHSRELLLLLFMNNGEYFQRPVINKYLSLSLVVASGQHSPISEEKNN